MITQRSSVSSAGATCLAGKYRKVNGAKSWQNFRTLMLEIGRLNDFSALISVICGR
jgi:hypothetical protein